MQCLNAASCLFLALLSGVVSPAADKLNVQIVQTHTGVKLGLGRLEVVNEADSASSRCGGTTGTYSRELGFYCGDSRVSAPTEMESRRVEALFYDIRVVMPDATRLVFHCSTILNQDCQGLPEYPESTSVVCSDFAYGGAAYKDCTATGPSAKGIGLYPAALHGDRITIFGSNWQRNYLRYGTWHFEVVDSQDPKPDPAQEGQQTKAAASDAKTAADSTADPKAPKPEPTGTPPPSTPDQVIDPRIIEQAKAGDPISQYKLGYDYFLGRGVPLDYVQAAIWWRKAADQGYPEAQNNLGVLYNSGKGVPQSYAEAYFWQNLAAARVSGPLQVQFAKNRDESGSKLWLLSRLKVQQKASKWAAEHPVPPRSHEPADAAREESP